MSIADDKDKWLSTLELSTVLSMFKDNGATEVLFKILPRNANSKNQVYMAPDLSQLGKIPSGETTLHQSTTQKGGGAKAVFRSALDFRWINKEGNPSPAPAAKLIFYPQYPEVRFSGFLKGCHDAPSSLYDKQRRGEEAGRVLVLGVGLGRKVLGITLPPEAPAVKELQARGPWTPYGAFYLLPIESGPKISGFLALMSELCRIHRRDWVPSARLNKHGVLVPCKSSNCNGNTLESLLGIRSNGYSLPDFMGWEVKARTVANSDLPSTSVVTLFTPEPSGGIYVEEGIVEFMRRYGYPDTKGRLDRINFGGIYRANAVAHARTRLRLVLDGYVSEGAKYSPSGSIRLLDLEDREVMSWSFAKLINHWKTKHASAAYVPAQQLLDPERRYRYGKNILVGEGAEFGLFLAGVHEGKVYYDPGIKLEAHSSTSPVPKKRSQFRVSSKHIKDLYVSSRVVDACEEADNS